MENIAIKLDKDSLKGLSMKAYGKNQVGIFIIKVNNLKSFGLLKKNVTIFKGLALKLVQFQIFRRCQENQNNESFICFKNLFLHVVKALKLG